MGCQCGACMCVGRIARPFKQICSFMDSWASYAGCACDTDGDLWAGTFSFRSTSRIMLCTAWNSSMLRSLEAIRISQPACTAEISPAGSHHMPACHDCLAGTSQSRQEDKHVCLAVHRSTYADLSLVIGCILHVAELHVCNPDGLSGILDAAQSNLQLEAGMSITCAAIGFEQAVAKVNGVQQLHPHRGADEGQPLACRRSHHQLLLYRSPVWHDHKHKVSAVLSIGCQPVVRTHLRHQRRAAHPGCKGPAAGSLHGCRKLYEPCRDSPTERLHSTMAVSGICHGGASNPGSDLGDRLVES